MNISNQLNYLPKEQNTPVVKRAIPRNSMQFLLCAVSENQNEGEPNTSVQTEQGPAKKAKLATLSVIPDKDRKRSYRLSSKRRQCRLDNEALASRTYNLTLDVNNLKQQVRYLQECRDLYVTRLAVARQHAEGEAVGMVTRLFRLFCHETCGTNEEQPDDRQLFLSRVHARLTDASAGGRDGIPLFMQTWRNFKLLFTHRSYTVKSIRLVSHVGAHDCEDHSASICASDVVMDEARQRCGPSGGCVVESAGAFTGRLKRDAIAAIYPKLLQDEELVTRLIGRKFSCSLRLKAYFNARGQLVDHVAEFDVLGALNEVILSTNRLTRDILRFTDCRAQDTVDYSS